MPNAQIEGEGRMEQAGNAHLLGEATMLAT